MKRKILRNFIALTSFILAFTPIADIYARSAEESVELTDEEWEELKDMKSELSDLEEEDGWDRKSWDEEHKEMAWMSFSSTSWNDKHYPSLNFSQFGTYTLSLTHLSENEEKEIKNAVMGYAITGAYTVRNPQDEENPIDNSAYVPIVLIAMDTLKAKGKTFAVQENPDAPDYAASSGSTVVKDEYCMAMYVSKSGTYQKDKNPDTYRKEIAKEILRRFISSERMYNAYHENKLNLFQSNNDGLLIALQSVLYTNTYAKTKTPYSPESAEKYYKASSRKNYFSDYNKFASDAISRYLPVESVGTYIMDGFGKRLEMTE